MNQNFFVLVLCLLLLAGTSLSKGIKDEGYLRSPDWRQRVSQWPPPGPDTIDIDEDQGDFELGSSSDDWESSMDPDFHGLFDDEDVDDVDDTEGSGTPFTHCQMLREKLADQKLIGAYMPRCTETGEFEPLQCSGGTGECWCVDLSGTKILGTTRRFVSPPDCSEINPRLPYGGPGQTHTDQTNRQPDPQHTGPHDSEGDWGFDPDDNRQEDRPDPKMSDPDDSDDPAEPGTEDQVRGAPTKHLSLIMQPGILAGIIGGAVVGLLCTVLLMMFIVYRMRKKDEGSYVLDDPKQKARDREFFA